MKPKSKKWRKILSSVIAVILCLSTAAGCSQTESTPEETTAGEQSRTEAETSVTTAKAETNGITDLSFVKKIDFKTNTEENGGNIILSWEAVPDADSYEIWRAGSRLGKAEPVGETLGLSYTDTDANSNKYENYYTIVARSNGDSIGCKTVSLELQLFGETMRFYDSKYDDVNDILREINLLHNNETFKAQFDDVRYSLYLKPGSYDWKFVNVGYNTQLAGLGKVPSEVKTGGIHTPPHLSNNNATCTFWRLIENIQVNSETSDIADGFWWAVSQAAPVRRLDVNAPSQFDWNGWASGGFAADCSFNKSAGSSTQQQWYTRNSYLSGGFYGVGWNNFAQGCSGTVASSDWNSGGNHTKIDSTPVIREKPFLYIDGDAYKVFVPALREDAVGVSWTEDDMGDGYSLDLLEDFHIARADVDTAESINQALDNGKHIFFTPGIYILEEPIHIKNADTVVLGTGLATLVPGQANTTAAMIIDDVDNVTVAGLLFEAYYRSSYLLRVGKTGDSENHTGKNTLLSDLFFRIGGVREENVHVDVAAQINSNDVIADHFWVWRADHGAGVGWERNTAPNGLIVTGDNVVCYGLFVEHYQEYQTLWLGENGRVYFYQCETPYDPTNQSVYMSHDGTVKGWAAYKVGNDVDNHFVAGMGVYDVFINTGTDRKQSESVFIENAIEVPDKENVLVQHACIVEIAGGGGAMVGINSIVNGTGNGISTGVGGKGFGREYIVSYQNGTAIAPSSKKTGTQPADEVFTLLSE